MDSLQSRAWAEGLLARCLQGGDWTSKQIADPPKKLWVRGIPTCGVLRIVPLFRRVVFVATGSGMAHRVPIRLLWTSPDVRKTFGDKLVDSILAASPDAVIYVLATDTRKYGKPDMVKLVYRLVREFDAEAVCVISNQKLTRKVVYGMMSRAPGRAPSFRQCLASGVRRYARVADTAVQAASSEDNALTIAPPGGLPDDSTTALSAIPRRAIKKYQVDIKPDHGLYGFFRKVEDDLGENVTYRTVEPPEGEALFPSGEHENPPPLRTEIYHAKEEARRMGIQNPSAWGSTKKATLVRLSDETSFLRASDGLRIVRKTMARIKYVLNERRLAYEGAIKLVEAEAEEVSALKEDEKVLKHQLKEWRKGRSLRKAARRQSRRNPDLLVSAPVEDGLLHLHPKFP
ncbi:NRPS protein biosynthetic cluster [Salix suchowensis]|nr:NRPS protein biosynthetic cluster [Salix suchowensis]